MISSLKANEYLQNQLKTWPYIGSETAGLFATYVTSTARCDIYDCSLLANALLMLNPNKPDLNAVRILEFFYGAYIYIKEKNDPNLILISAAFTQNENGQIDVCYDPSCQAQDLGNNALVLIAVTKFCLLFPENENTSKYKEMIEYLFKNIISLQKNCGEYGEVYAGRQNPNERYVSSEHLIDLFALAKMCKSLVNVSNDQIITNTQNFVIKMFYQNPDNFAAYRIGLTPNCELNTQSPQPVDTTTWNLLANVDPDKKRMEAAMRTVCEKFVISGQYPGIKFSIASDCAQLENTGSFLCSLAVYEQRFKERFNCPASQEMYDIIIQYINENKPIPGSFDVECPTALGWSYYPIGHLAATVYCTLGATKNPNLNIYQFSNPIEPPKDNITCPSNTGYIVSISILSLLLLIVILVFAFTRK